MTDDVYVSYENVLTRYELVMSYPPQRLFQIQDFSEYLIIRS